MKVRRARPEANSLVLDGARRLRRTSKEVSRWRSDGDADLQGIDLSRDLWIAAAQTVQGVLAYADGNLEHAEQAWQLAKEAALAAGPGGGLVADQIQRMTDAALPSAAD